MSNDFASFSCWDFYSDREVALRGDLLEQVLWRVEDEHEEDENEDEDEDGFILV